jgi:hypothetical protein
MTEKMRRRETFPENPGVGSGTGMLLSLFEKRATIELTGLVIITTNASGHWTAEDFARPRIIRVEGVDSSSRGTGVYKNTPSYESWSMKTINNKE